MHDTAALLGSCARTFPPGARAGATSYELGSCNGLSHHDRVEVLAKIVRSLSPLASSNGRQHHTRKRFVLPVTHWHVGATLASPLLEELSPSQAIILTQDAHFFDQSRGFPELWNDPSWRVKQWSCRAFDSRYVVTVPYPTGSYGSQKASSEQRPTLVQFRGNTAMSRCDASKADGPLPVYCKLREALVSGATAGACNAAGLSITAVNKRDDESFSYDGNYVSPTEAFTEMQQSTFCLVPRGDTPSSRRFFLAIAAGCIPVLIVDDYEPPFRQELDYDKCTLTFTVRSAVHNPCSIFEALRNVSAERVREMQTQLASVGRQLSYGTVSPSGAFQPGGAIDSMLSGLKRAISEQDEFAASQVHGPCGIAVKGDNAVPKEVLERYEPWRHFSPSRRPSELFFIFAQPRTASTTITENLDQHPDITMLGEALRSDEWSQDAKLLRKVRCDLGYCTEPAMRADLAGYMRTIALHCPTRLCGMKIFADHLPRENIDGQLVYVVDELFVGWKDAPGQKRKAIVLERNDTAAEYNSLKAAYESGNWGTTPCKQAKVAEEDIGNHPGFTQTLPEFEAEKRAWYDGVRSALGQGPQLSMPMETEEIIANSTAATLRALQFLGLKPAPGHDLEAPWQVCAEDA